MLELHAKCDIGSLSNFRSWLTFFFFYLQSVLWPHPSHIVWAVFICLSVFIYLSVYTIFHKYLSALKKLSTFKIAPQIYPTKSSFLGKYFFMGIHNNDDISLCFSHMIDASINQPYFTHFILPFPLYCI